MDIDKVIGYFHEIGHCKMETRSGWKHIGVKSPESVAEHSFRAAQIGFVLAHMENYPNPERIAMVLLFHDNAEARISDFDKLASVYMNEKKESEMAALKDQIQHLSPKIQKKIIGFFQDFECVDGSLKSNIIRDADLLELAFQAKEYFDRGYKLAQIFLDNIGHLFSTDSAKMIFEDLDNGTSAHWWITPILGSNILKQKKDKPS